jgi:hypothetical protein
VFIDALTALQVDERVDMTPAQIVDRFATQAAEGRARTRSDTRIDPAEPVAGAQQVGDQEEAWTVGYLVDVILTRDPWMHRADIVRATGANHVLTADHDGVLVADIVAEWAARHGQPYTLRLAGPAGGIWRSGEGGPYIELDAIEFCRWCPAAAPPPACSLPQVPF